MEILYGFDKGNVYNDYAMIPFDMDKVTVGTKERKRVINDYEELKEWWNQ